MKIMVTWFKKDRTCRTWTNANPCEHGAMSATIICDAAKRLASLYDKKEADVIEKLEEYTKKLLKEGNAE